MKGLTEKRPKCLVELNGKPLLQMQIEAIEAAGLTEIGIVTGYKSELLDSFGIAEFHNSRWSETNMVSSLECANEWLDNYSCIVSYSDIFYDSSAISALTDCTSEIGITYDANWAELWQGRFDDPLSDAETFRLDVNGKLLEIGNKPESIDEVEGQYMGLLFFSPTGWKEVKTIRMQLSQADRDRMHLTGTLQKVIERGTIDIQAIPYRGYWGEVDSESDLIFYQEQH